MHRLSTFVATLAVVGGIVAYGDAQAQQKQRQVRPPPQPQIIQRDRSLYGPPPPVSPERNYYGPAPTIQQPMERVPMPAPLAQPPINR
jgi:hypothetical protein